jgi:hypothetical protein
MAKTANFADMIILKDHAKLLICPRITERYRLPPESHRRNFPPGLARKYPIRFSPATNYPEVDRAEKKKQAAAKASLAEMEKNL